MTATPATETLTAAVAHDLATYRDEFPNEAPDHNWFAVACEMDGRFDWEPYWTEVERLYREAAR